MKNSPNKQDNPIHMFYGEISLGEDLSVKIRGKWEKKPDWMTKGKKNSAKCIERPRRPVVLPNYVQYLFLLYKINADGCAVNFLV